MCAILLYLILNLEGVWGEKGVYLTFITDIQLMSWLDSKISTFKGLWIYNAQYKVKCSFI